MQEEGFEEMREYVINSQNTFAQYIATQPILDLCEETVRTPGAWSEKCGGNMRYWNWREEGRWRRYQWKGRGERRIKGYRRRRSRELNIFKY